MEAASAEPLRGGARPTSSIFPRSSLPPVSHFRASISPPSLRAPPAPGGRRRPGVGESPRAAEAGGGERTSLEPSKTRGGGAGDL